MATAVLNRVRLLGYPEIEGVPATASFPARGFCLLALLALMPARQLSRVEAAAQLWDNAETSAVLGNMRQLISRMNKMWPGISALLVVDDKFIRLRDGVDHIDICQLLEPGWAERNLDLEGLIAIYRGNLLDGITPASEMLSHAIQVARAALSERYFGLMRAGLKEATRYGRADIELLRKAEQRLLALDPAREDNYKALIAAYGAVGKPEEAKRLYNLLAVALHLDGADGPMHDTRSSLARATVRSVEAKAASTAAAEKDARVVLPRVALLAPRWVASPDGYENILSALIEDTANELARYRSLTTLAAHSSFQAAHDGGIIGENRLLRADYTVSSFIRPGEGMGELCVRLVNCASGSIIWTGEFPLRHDMLLRSFRSLVGRVAADLSVAVEEDAIKELERTGNPSSYLHFLRAQNILKHCDLRNVRRARKAYAESVKEDPRFAEAYSGVSCALYLEWLLLGGNDPKLLAEARELADMAIDCDPLSSSGHWRKAMVTLYQHDFDRSEQCFQRARDLHPNSADILLDHSDALGFIGDADEAWGLFERALDLNPTPPDHYWWAGASVAFSKADYGKAIELCRRLSSDEAVLRLLAACHGQLGNHAEAREYGRRLMETYPGETAESMTRLQPHRSRESLQTFIDGLRMAGIR